MATLRELRASGVSAKKIAVQLGCTRNAVIGRAARMGLDRLRTGARLGVKHERPRVARHPNNNFLARNIRKRAATPLGDDLPPQRIDDLATPVEQRKSLLELTSGTCKWPVGNPGEPGFFFCGAKTEDGKPYCSGHCAVAYQPPSEKKAARRAA